MRTPNPKQFDKDVSNHVMTIVNDNGVNRCIQFADPKTFNLHFTLTTWPGYLCISGDMGTYVFARLKDMFEFFRSAKGETNPDYWAEKCEAADKRTGGATDCYDKDIFRERVKERVDDYFTDKKQRARCWQEIEDTVLHADSEYEAHDNARKFEFEGFQLTDFWECNLRRDTYQYLWCCLAIVWGIHQYDAAKAVTA